MKALKISSCETKMLFSDPGLYVTSVFFFWKGVKIRVGLQIKWEASVVQGGSSCFKCSIYEI